MPDAPTDQVDPFQPADGVLARFAARLGFTEGQLYSTAVGLLLTWVTAANGLPSVAWGGHGAGPVAFASGPVPTSSPSPAAPVVVVPTGSDPGSASTPVRPLPLPVLSEAPAPLGNPLAQPEPAPTTVAESPSSSPAASPLTVASGGYASANAGTPLATAGVPAGSVAVALQGGQPDKVTYLHLAGAGPALELVLDPSGTSTPNAFAAIQMCVVTQPAWTVGQGDVALAAAPTYDCTTAVPGVLAGSGDRWTFDVRRLDTRNGVAILPSGSASVPSFQLVFSIGKAGA